MYSATKELLDRAMVGKYVNMTGHASVFCRIIYSEEDVTARVRLMEYLLANFGLTPRTGELVVEYPVIVFSDKFIEELHGRIGEGIETFINDLLKENPRSIVLARKVIKFLDVYANPEDKFLALAMILVSPLIPYTQLTPDMFERVGGVTEISEQLCRSVAIMKRAFRQPGLDFSQILSIVQVILSRHKDPKEFQNLLLGFAMEFEQKNARERFASLVGEGGLEEILAAGLPAAVLGARHADCQNPNCPIHGGGKKAEKKPS